MELKNIERRACKRYPLQVPLFYKKGGKFYWSITEDISLNGLFFQSFNPPDPGEELEIHLSHTFGEEDLVFQGKVIHKRERNKALIPGEALPSSAGAGITFGDLPLLLRKNLVSVFTVQGASVRKPVSYRIRDHDPVLKADSQESGKEYQRLEDPDAVVKVFECLCRNIHDIRLKRLGNEISYSTYFRSVLRTSNGIQVQAEPVEFKDADLAFNGKIPIVFHFCLGDRYYVFTLLKHAKALSKVWTFSVPRFLYFIEDRRYPRFSLEMKNPLAIEFPDPHDLGRQLVKNVLDVSYKGLAFKNYPGDEVYKVGTTLPDVMIYAFDLFCRRTDVIIKHVSLVCQPGGDVFQRIGVEFPDRGQDSLAEIPRIKEGEMEEISGVRAIDTHLKGIIRGQVKLLAEAGQCILFTDGLLQLGKKNRNEELLVTSDLLPQKSDNAFREGAISYHYLFRGIYHFFTATSRVENGFLRTEAPRNIYKAKRRRTLRVKARKAENRFCFLHPMLGKRFSLQLLDISSRGLSFEADCSQVLLWKGFCLRACEILLGGEYLSLGRVEIRSLSETINQEGITEKRCGVEFLDLPAQTERRISALIFQHSNPKIHSLTAEKIEKLWQLFHQSGFMYPSKEAYIRKIMPAINKTWEKLLSGETSFYKNIVFREGEEEELGTASAVQVYENTWMFQHLAAAEHPIKLIPKYVLLGLAHFLMENQEIKYLITYFRKENSFPRKIYSGFLEAYPLEEQLRFTKHSFLSCELNGGTSGQVQEFAASCPEGVVIEEANETDKEIMENYFRKNLHPLLIRSRSLYRDTFQLPETSALFCTKGLNRERRCLVARERGEGILAFALLENSSPGINLSGLLNSFSVFSVREGGERNRQVRKRLIESCINFYRSWGARTAICLTSEEDITDYLAQGFKKEKEYICFTSSRRAIKNYYDYVQERFGRFEERRLRSIRERSPAPSRFEPGTVGHPKEKEKTKPR